MPGVNLEQAHFHEVVDDDAAVFMIDLVKGYGDIHVFRSEETRLNSSHGGISRMPSSA